MIHAFLITLAVLAAIYLFPIIPAILGNRYFWILIFVSVGLLSVFCYIPALVGAYQENERGIAQARDTIGPIRRSLFPNQLRHFCVDSSTSTKAVD